MAARSNKELVVPIEIESVKLKLKHPKQRKIELINHKLTNISRGLAREMGNLKL